MTLLLIVVIAATILLLAFYLRPFPLALKRASKDHPHCAVVYAFWESDYHPWIQPRKRVLWRHHYATQEEAVQAAKQRALFEDHHGFGVIDRDCGIGWEIVGPQGVAA